MTWHLALINSLPNATFLQEICDGTLNRYRRMRSPQSLAKVGSQRKVEMGAAVGTSSSIYTLAHSLIWIS